MSLRWTAIAGERAQFGIELQRIGISANEVAVAVRRRTRGREQVCPGISADQAVRDRQCVVGLENVRGSPIVSVASDDAVFDDDWGRETVDTAGGLTRLKSTNAGATSSGCPGRPIGVS